MPASPATRTVATAPRLGRVERAPQLSQLPCASDERHGSSIPPVSHRCRKIRMPPAER